MAPWSRRAVISSSSNPKARNTVAVCRKSYVHPAVVEGFLEGDVIATTRRAPPKGHRLTADEAAVARLIDRRTRASRRTAKKVA